jgi:hypothetical protein
VFPLWVSYPKNRSFFEGEKTLEAKMGGLEERFQNLASSG